LDGDNFYDAYPVANWAEIHGFQFTEDNYFFISMKKYCFSVEKEPEIKKKRNHKIELKPVNKDTITLDELADLVENVYPLDKRVIKEKKFYERLLKATDKARIGIRNFFSFLFKFS
jgi:hypothetical protein